MPLRPLNDVLIVEPDKNERFDSSLVLPENNSIEKISRFATVISAGRRCLYKWSFGDRILINRFFDIPDGNSVYGAIHSIEPDEIYNLAAQSFVPVSWTNPLLTFQVNVMGVINILEVVKEMSFGPKVYQASSSEMCGNSHNSFEPCSPYGVSKLASHWLVKDYREKYDMFACSGICFNHESPRRSGEFVTQKIAKYVKVSDFSIKLKLGNLESRRDWGFAGDYVEAMWLMLQQDKPDDYVIATGISHTVAQFCEEAFRLK